MKRLSVFSKQDILVIMGCCVLILLNIGAVNNSGRRRAKEMVCQSKLHQWGKVFEMYANDYNGKFMHGFTSNRGPNRWISALGEYYKWDNNLTCCPSAIKPVVNKYGISSGEQGTEAGVFLAWGYYMQAYWPELMKGSYGINGWCVDPQPGLEPNRSDKSWFWRGPNVAESASVPLFLDSLRYNGLPLHTDRPPFFSGEHWNSDAPMGRYCINRQNGSVNCLFLDFSVRAVGLKELWTLKWHREFDTNGPWTVTGGMRPEDWPSWMRNFKDY